MLTILFILFKKIPKHYKYHIKPITNVWKYYSDVVFYYAYQLYMISSVVVFIIKIIKCLPNNYKGGESVY